MSKLELKAAAGKNGLLSESDLLLDGQKIGRANLYASGNFLACIEKGTPGVGLRSSPTAYGHGHSLEEAMADAAVYARRVAAGWAAHAEWVEEMAARVNARGGTGRADPAGINVTEVETASEVKHG